MIDVHQRSAGDYGVEIRINRGPGLVGETDVVWWPHHVCDAGCDNDVHMATARPCWPNRVEMDLDWIGATPPIEVIEVVREEITSLYEDLRRDRA